MVPASASGLYIAAHAYSRACGPACDLAYGSARAAGVTRPGGRGAGRGAGRGGGRAGGRAGAPRGGRGAARTRKPAGGPKRARGASRPARRASSAEQSVGAALEAVRRLVRALRIGASQARDAAGISSAELFVLRALDERGPVESLNELAARTYTDQSSASPIVDRLHRRRLIRRQRSAVDARRITIALTSAGRALLARAPVPPQAEVITALHRMGSGERDALARGLTRLVAQMGLAGLRSAMLFEDPPT